MPEKNASTLSVETGLITLGEPPKSNKSLLLVGKGKSGVSSALLNRAASFAADTAWWVYTDSSQGYIQRIRVHAGQDNGRPYAGRDSTVYRWPYHPTSPVVLFSLADVKFQDGWENWWAIHDDDGDGTLNQAGVGKTVKLRKVWAAAKKDTLWSSAWYTDHGQSNFYDSLEAGRILWWSDTTYVDGKAAWWQRTYDGDGFALTAASGKSILVKVDSYADNRDGIFLFGFDQLGAGPDKDYLKWEDNELLPSLAITVNGQGENLSKRETGDADGDGFYWTPAAGASNRAWETYACSGRNGFKTYRDSLVKTIKDVNTGAGDLIAYFSAAMTHADGRAVFLTTGAGNGKDAYGDKDTVVVLERIAYPEGAAAWNEAGDLDSSRRVTHLIPNRLERGDDDQIVWWSYVSHYKPGHGKLTRSESLAPKSPLAAGAAADAHPCARGEIPDRGRHRREPVLAVEGVRRRPAGILLEGGA